MYLIGKRAGVVSVLFFLLFFQRVNGDSGDSLDLVV
jgi:hypothetical protein